MERNEDGVPGQKPLGLWVHPGGLNRPWGGSCRSPGEEASPQVLLRLSRLPKALPPPGGTPTRSQVPVIYVDQVAGVLISW